MSETTTNGADQAHLTEAREMAAGAGLHPVHERAVIRSLVNLHDAKEDALARAQLELEHREADLYRARQEAADFERQFNGATAVAAEVRAGYDRLHATHATSQAKLDDVRDAVRGIHTDGWVAIRKWIEGEDLHDKEMGALEGALTILRTLGLSFGLDRNLVLDEQVTALFHCHADVNFHIEITARRGEIDQFNWGRSLRDLREDDRVSFGHSHELVEAIVALETEGLLDYDDASEG